MKKVQLYSENTFTVYKELSFIDKSIDLEKAKVMAADNLIRIQPSFIPSGIKIRKGSHQYDEVVMQYPTVISFIERGIIQIIGGKLEDYIKKPKKKSTKKVEDEVKEEPKTKKKTTTKKKSLTEVASK